MLKKFCDRCGKELNHQPFWDIDATAFGKSERASAYYQYDLCENCMKEVDKFIKRGK